MHSSAAVRESIVKINRQSILDKKQFAFTIAIYDVELQHLETIEATNHQEQTMKIVYTREEVIEIMKTTVSELIDVDIEEIEFSNYGKEFLHITCTKQAKKFEVEPSYQTPFVPGE